MQENFSDSHNTPANLIVFVVIVLKFNPIIVDVSNDRLFFWGGRGRGSYSCTWLMKSFTRTPSKDAPFRHCGYWIDTSSGGRGFLHKISSLIMRHCRKDRRVLVSVRAFQTNVFPNCTKNTDILGGGFLKEFQDNYNRICNIMQLFKNIRVTKGCNSLDLFLKFKGLYFNCV